MRPVLFDALGIRLFSYTVLLDVALAVGLIVAVLCARRRSVGRSRVLDAGLWGILGALIGARAHHVLVHWGYYASQPDQIVRFWQGGYCLAGGIVTGLVAVWLYARSTRTAPLALLDTLAPGVATGTVLGWIGCYLAGCAYGRTARGLGTLLLPDIYGLMEHRYATQLIAAVASLVVLALTVAALLRARRAGWALVAWLAGTFATLLGLEFIRGDDSLMLVGARLGVWLNGAGLLATAALAWVLARRRPSTPRPIAPTDAPIAAEAAPSEGSPEAASLPSQILPNGDEHDRPNRPQARAESGPNA